MKSFSFIKRRSDKVLNYDNYIHKSFRKCLKNSDVIMNNKLEKIRTRFNTLFKQLNESNIKYYHNEIYAINGSENYDFCIVRDRNEYDTCDIELKIYINRNSIIIKNISYNGGNPMDIEFHNNSIIITLVDINNKHFVVKWSGKHFKIHKFLIEYNYKKILSTIENIIEVLDLVDKNINEICDSVKSIVIEAISDHKNTLDKCKEKINKINKYIDKGKIT